MSLILRLLSGSFGGWIIAGSLLVATSTGWFAHGVWTDANRLDELERVVAKANKERAESLEASKLLETTLAAERAKRIEMEGRLRHELQNRVYTDCVIPPSGVQLLREAVGSPAR